MNRTHRPGSPPEAGAPARPGRRRLRVTWAAAAGAALIAIVAVVLAIAFAPTAGRAPAGAGKPGRFGSLWLFDAVPGGTTVPLGAATIRKENY